MIAGGTRRIRLSAIAAFGLAAVLLLCQPSALAQSTTHVDVVSISGVIDPVVAQYVTRGIEMAQQDQAQCVVIQIDTPGGSDGPMRDIVQAILNSPAPVVVYVAPDGARAASAGVFITLAADIAAMAPGTNIGAAHPVGISGAITGTLNTKATNDAAAYIRAITERRGRNADWAEKAVRESISITAKEALDAETIDLIADDMDDLLQKIDGWNVSTAGGQQTLKTAGAVLQYVPMSLPKRVLHAIVDPNISYLLLTIGLWGLVAEFYHPGAIIPGVTGAVSLILAFVAFGSLPVNWGGVALIILAIVLFILDIKVAGFGLSIGGAVAFVLGSLMIFKPVAPTSPVAPQLSVSRPLIAVLTASITAFFLFVVSAAIRAQRSAPLTGTGILVGARGTASSDLNPLGVVQVKSELWSARATGDMVIKKGQRVVVVGVEGLQLRVRAEAVPDK